MAEGGDDCPWKVMAGKWKVDRSENFEEYLKQGNVPSMIRALLKNSKGKFLIDVDGNKVTMSAKLGLLKFKNTFLVNSGTETDASFNGKTVKAKTTWENGKLIVVSQGSADGEIKPQKVIREMVGEELVQTMEVGTCVARRYCRRYVKKK